MDNQEKKKKIIVADDSHTIRLVMKKYLEDKYEVLEASNGEEVFSIVSKLESGASKSKDKKAIMDVAAILVSMEMSDYNGFEVAAELRRKYDKKHLPIILNTSQNKREIIMNALDAGMNDYIVKPFPKELLISKIHKLEREIPVENIELSESISKIPFFSHVPDSQVAYAINTCSEEISKEKGGIICAQNDKNYDLYILMEGKCDIIYNDKKVSEIEPVDTIGEMGFLEEKERSATVIATELSKFIVFKKAPFDKFLNEDRAILEIICKNVIHTLSDRIKRSNKLIEQLKVLAHEHLAY